MYYKIKTCRVCFSKKLQNKIILKPMPLGDKYASKKNLFNRFIEINIIECKIINFHPYKIKNIINNISKLHYSVIF